MSYDQRVLFAIILISCITSYNTKFRHSAKIIGQVISGKKKKDISLKREGQVNRYTHTHFK